MWTKCSCIKDLHQDSNTNKGCVLMRSFNAKAYVSFKNTDLKEGPLDGNSRNPLCRTSSRFVVVGVLPVRIVEMIAVFSAVVGRILRRERRFRRKHPVLQFSYC